MRNVQTTTKQKQDVRAEFREKCIGLSVDTVFLCRSLHEDSTLWPLIDQVIRSTGSIGANVIEGQAAASRKDFTNFMRIAYKSSQESRYWFTVLHRTCPKHAEAIQGLGQRVDELSKVLSASLRTLQSR